MLARHLVDANVLLEGDVEVGAQLLVVLSDCLMHALQVSIDLALLVDLLHELLTLVFDLIDVALELGYHVAHLLLICLLFCQFSRQHILALPELLDIALQIEDFLLHLFALLG